MKPFDYQLDFIDNIFLAFKRRSKKVIAQLSTGGGKTVVMAEITRRAILKGSVVCIAVHRTEIFNQTFKALGKFGITPSLIAPGSHPRPGAQMYLCMVETMKRRMDKGLIEKLNINFFILDEVHYGSYYKLVQQLNCYILGFTATPKTTGKPELKEYFDTITCGIPITELIRIGRLVPTKTYSVTHDFSKVKMKGGDYDPKLLAIEFHKPKLWTGAVTNYMKICPGAKALCFSVSVEQSLDVTNQFRDHGIRAAHVDGNTPDADRASIFRLYENDEIDVICNVGIATTGTDLPTTQCIIKNYATTSLVKDVQVGGRGGRASEGKSFFYTIDNGRNWIRHGEFGHEIDWVDIFQNPIKATKKEDEGRSTKRECDECGSVIRFKLHVCPVCGHFTDSKQLEQKMLIGATAEEIKAFKLRTLPINLRRNPKDLSHEELKTYAMHMGYKPSWVWQMKKVWGRT